MPPVICNKQKLPMGKRAVNTNQAVPITNWKTPSDSSLHLILCDFIHQHLREKDISKWHKTQFHVPTDAALDFLAKVTHFCKPLYSFYSPFLWLKLHERQTWNSHNFNLNIKNRLGKISQLRGSQGIIQQKLSCQSCFIKSQFHMSFLRVLFSWGRKSCYCPTDWEKQG